MIFFYYINDDASLLDSGDVDISQHGLLVLQISHLLSKVSLVQHFLLACLSQLEILILHACHLVLDPLHLKLHPVHLLMSVLQLIFHLLHLSRLLLQRLFVLYQLLVDF